MAESIVQKKLAKLIKLEVSEILTFGQKFVPGGMLTVSVVRVTADLGLAKIYVTAFPDEKLSPAIEALNESAWEIRRQLAGKIRNKVRKIPEIRFYADDSFLEADKIDRLLKDI